MKRSVFFILLAVFLASCGGRIPSDAKTANLSKGYFHKYGKKYKDTVFYKNKVSKVEVKKTQELQKDVATSFVLVSLNEGQEIPVILSMIRKFPLGWRVTGWEWVKNP